jgi:hypothetical protein
MLGKVWMAAFPKRPKESEWIFYRDCVLRVFFAVYFLLSSIQWYFDRTLFNGPFAFISDDLSGHRGNDISYLLFNLTFLKTSPLGFGVFALAATGCGLILFMRTRALGALALLISGQLIAYAMGCRNIAYEMIYISLMGYGTGLLIAASPLKLEPFQRAKLPWLLAVCFLFSLYTVAAMSKMSLGGIHWANTTSVGGLMHYGQFRNEVGAASIGPPAVLIKYFNSPRALSAVLLTLSVTIEASGIFAIFWGDFVWIPALIMIGMHVGMLLSIVIMFRAVVVQLALIAIPWNLVGRRSVESFAHRRTTVFTALSLSMMVVLLCWQLPTSPVRNVTALVWPFGRFTMFARRIGPFSVYYFKDSDGKLVESRDVQNELRVSITSLNSFVRSQFPSARPNMIVADFVCAFVNRTAPSAGILRRKEIVVWSRFFHFDENGSWVDTDTKMKTCELTNKK